MCRAENEINSIIFQIVFPCECTCTAQTVVASFPEVGELNYFIFSSP